MPLHNPEKVLARRRDRTVVLETLCSSAEELRAAYTPSIFWRNRLVFPRRALRFLLRRLDVSDSAEGLGQGNEIKDEPPFLHFLQSSRAGVKECGPTVVQLCVEKKKKKKNLTQLQSTIVMSGGPLPKDLRSPISRE